MLLMICLSMFLIVIRFVMLLYLLMMIVRWLWFMWKLCSSMFRCFDFGMNMVGCSILCMLNFFLV